jgi:hypothetical protein
MATDKDSRSAIHRRKSHMHRSFHNSMLNTNNQITTFCVLTQHSTVQWHIVPWLHTALICCSTELRQHRHRSHSSNTMAEGKVVPVYTMKTFSRSTVTTTVICNLSRKLRWVISLMHQLFQHWRRIHNIHWIRGQIDRCAGLMFWIEGKSLASPNKQTAYGPASRLSP